MTLWKLSVNLTHSEDPDWAILFDSSFSGPIHPERKNGFCLSRDALRKCLAETGISASLRHLKLSNYSTLSHYPELTISLSHTKNCGAALIADTTSYRSVGIDIENETRTVKDSILERISHPSDFNLRKIELWCLKEAVFKTLMNTGLFSHPIEFSSIQIGQNNWSHSPLGLNGEWELNVIDGLVVARAYLKAF